MESKRDTHYHADLYLRLSREDGDKSESDSITNQRNLLMDFLENHPEIKLHQIRIDDGYSGVDFHRPDFIKMMESIKKQEINCVIVKDFSRLGRNFIETGKYIEKLFPFMGVRFISVIDNYDSERPRTSADSLLVPVKNLLNDAYCQDISIKIRSNFQMKRNRGECVAPFAVYGYRKDPGNRNRLLVDELVAGTVRDIFKRKLEGYSAQAIADWLNETGILSPMEHKRYLGSDFSCPFQRNVKARWTAAAVARILHNPVYIGTLVQGKTSSLNYKIKARVALPKERWAQAEHCHEPIVSEEMFATVAHLLSVDTRTSPGKETVYPFSGLLRCGDCHRNMVRKNYSSHDHPYVYHVCSGHKQKTGCSSHSVSAAQLDEAILAAVQGHIRILLDHQAVIRKMGGLPDALKAVKDAKKRLSDKRAEIEKYQHYRLSLHENYLEGMISKEECQAFGKRYDGKIEDARAAMFKLEQEIERLAKDNADVYDWPTYFEQCHNIPRLDRKLAAQLVECVYIYEHQRIKIKFKFQDEYKGEAVWLMK